MVTKIRGWIAAHPRWSVAIFAFIAIPVIAYSALIWKASLRPDRLASVSLLVKQFDQVMFQKEPDEANLKRIVKWVKWTNQVSIKIVGDGGDRWKEVIERHVAIMRELTGVDFLIGSIPYNPDDLFIYFAEPEDFERIVIKHIRYPGEILESLQGRTCLSYYTISSRVIEKSIIIVSTDRSDYLTAVCLFQQLSRILGFPNASELIRPSAFSLWDYDLRSLSINDRIIVRTLYDKRMRVGLNREHALYRARLIITELVAEAKAKEAASGD